MTAKPARPAAGSKKGRFTVDGGGGTPSKPSPIPSRTMSGGSGGGGGGPSPLSASPSANSFSRTNSNNWPYVQAQANGNGSADLLNQFSTTPTGGFGSPFFSSGSSFTPMQSHFATQQSHPSSQSLGSHSLPGSHPGSNVTTPLEAMPSPWATEQSFDFGQQGQTWNQQADQAAAASAVASLGALDQSILTSLAEMLAQQQTGSSNGNNSGNGFGNSSSNMNTNGNGNNAAANSLNLLNLLSQQAAMAQQHQPQQHVPSPPPQDQFMQSGNFLQMLQQAQMQQQQQQSHQVQMHQQEMERRQQQHQQQQHHQQQQQQQQHTQQQQQQQQQQQAQQQRMRQTSLLTRRIQQGQDNSVQQHQSSGSRVPAPHGSGNQSGHHSGYSHSVPSSGQQKQRMPAGQWPQNETTVSTPASDSSPADTSSNSSRTFRPIKPRRREAPQHPAAPSKPAAKSSSSFVAPQPPRRESRQPTQEADVKMDIGNLPPLPAGLTISHLSEYGNAGLEMAIRMGMGIGMGMALGQQQASQQAQQTSPAPQSQPMSPPSAPHVSFATVLESASPSVSVSSPEASSQAIPTRQRSGDVVSNILNDNFFGSKSPLSTSPPVPAFAFSPRRRPSVSGDPGSPSALPDVSDPEEMARKDPLAHQVWKAYARAKNTLPHGQRMENLTWRLMHLTMKKPDEAGASGNSADLKHHQPPLPSPQQQQQQHQVATHGFMPLSPVAEPGHEVAAAPHHRDSDPELQERGRRKGVSRVVGFSAGARENRERDSSAMDIDWRAASRSRSRMAVDWRAASRSRSRSAFPGSRGMYDAGNEEHAHSLLAQTTSNSSSSNNNMNPSPASFAPFARSMPNNFPPWVAPGVEMAMSQPLQSELNVEQFNMQEPPKAETSFDYGEALRNASGSHSVLATSGPSASGRLTEYHSQLASQLAQSLSSASSRDSKSKYHTLPGISGPGLYQASEENYHPQYGLLPRRVRKTSFDHTVRPVMEDDDNNMLTSRKRPAEASPHNHGGTHRPLPDGNITFPSGDFTFNYDEYNFLGGDAGGSTGFEGSSSMAASGSNDLWVPEPEAGSSRTVDTSLFASYQASTTEDQPFDLQQLMHFYPDNSNNLPFGGTINPSDVLGGRMPPAVADYSPAQSPPPNAELSIPPPRFHPPGPQRSNSSPNLQGLKMSKSHSRQHSGSGPSRSSKGKSGPGTPVSGNEQLDGEAATTCTNCNTNNTPLWRRDPEGHPLCNACGLFYKLHGVVRPLSLKTDVIKKRNRGAPTKETRKSGKSRSSKATSPAAERTSAPGSSITKRQRRASDAPDSGTTSLASSLGTGGMLMTKFEQFE